MKNIYIYPMSGGGFFRGGGVEPAPAKAEKKRRGGARGHGAGGDVAHPARGLCAQKKCTTMAILTGGLLGKSRNKVGSLVTYVLGIKQVARSLAANISNPRTEAQMAQRTRMANLVNFYKANSTWMNTYAFTRRRTGWSVYNAFVSANIGSRSVYLTKSEAAQGCAIVAPYKVTDGTIPTIVHSPYNGANGLTDIYLGNAFEITAATTVGDLSEAILANNNGVAAGWQLSLIINYQQSSGSVYYIIPRYYEVTLAVGDTTLLSERMPLDHIDAIPTAAQTNTQLAYVGGQTDPEAGYCFIWSANDGGTVRVSSQYMELTDTGIYNSYTESAQRTAAIDSYGTSSEPFLTPGYSGSGASDSSVTIPTSILRAVLNGTTANIGAYLGTWGGEQAGTVGVTFNRDVDASTVESVIIAWEASGGGSMTYTEGITADGASLTVAVPVGSTPPPTAAITAITVAFSTGSILRASFRASEEIEE